jgi:hypothetical protein
MVRTCICLEKQVRPMIASAIGCLQLLRKQLMPGCAPAVESRGHPVKCNWRVIFKATVAVKAQRAGKAVAGVKRQLSA